VFRRRTALEVTAQVAHAPGSAAHTCGIHFENLTGTQFQLVFYRGDGPAYQDLVAGHVDLMCAEASATLPLLSVGRSRCQYWADCITNISERKLSTRRHDQSVLIAR
jgi:tripartite-type tricarboxylate transporter receptor subunit TctC